MRELSPKGVQQLLLSHDDFVSMSGHAKWQKAFKLLRSAHRLDAGGLGFEEELEAEVSKAESAHVKL